MRKSLSSYKFKKNSIEAYKNGLRLHFDSILLFRHKSFPSAYQLSVLAMEEFSKSYMVEHYYYSSVINGNFPDSNFEQKWLNMLYLHPRKQSAFFGWGMAFDYQTKFVKMIERGELELRKQKATYVGLHKHEGHVDVNSRISLPDRTKATQSKQLISLLNDYLIDHHDMFRFCEYHFDMVEKNALLTHELYND